MATITKLYIDSTNENLVISATSSGATTEDGVTIHHKFTRIFIDLACTFNCKSEPSSNATTIVLTADDFDTWVDGDLVDYTVPFSDILSDDILNDILFVWIEETPYTDEAGTQQATNLDLDYYFGVTLHVKTLYNHLLSHISLDNSCGCASSCNPDCADVNIMLAWQGFNLAKTLQDYRQMINYWNIIHTTNTTSSYSSGCNCH